MQAHAEQLRAKPQEPVVRLSALAHGGGCGCKISPGLLTSLLSQVPAAEPFASLLVGTETADDAAVWKLNGETCIIATTDFFMPVVDDPYDFGRIAATNAISDIYAMAGKPLFALAILGIPLHKLPTEIAGLILAGGAAACAAAGIPIAGGHSIDAPEPIYGLAVIGMGRPDQIRRNSMAKPNDSLLLTKPLGVGVYSAALKKDLADAKDYGEMLASTTLLNSLGAELAADPSIHAMTDVTGFGLLGHALEVARGSGLAIEIDAASLPFLSRAEEWARAGCVTGASRRNWASYSADIDLRTDLPEWRQHLLTDPQTSGGLLISCAPEAAERITRVARGLGYPRTAVIGRAISGRPAIILKA